ncbi:methylated-DNA--[protein]-cysteine S-methyltransferase [Jiella pacifica]|uniref:methylated-DNA--[protein]-cysteine S-methyltransferase n=1 Tax=Jiella pacifica TaxID=2696469 RepID=A0A6N9T6M3_9HYPH|nr:methylated-DNA--[protein]-cysteine S-methyltransferase [Jiella pacifica]NDW06202.1 methylated-DNA--[protein]-cysteine S-methyltransferase [Jiella pacifica]
MGKTFFIERQRTPIGHLVLLTDIDDRLRVADWEDYAERMNRLLALKHGTVAIEERPGRSEACRAFDAYFAGEVDALSSISVRMTGTPFQCTVWNELLRIEVGTTITYGELARRIGRPTVFRAVGYANSLNPINIAVPCHRVVGANASLTGYGGGLPRKQWLLDHEAGRPTLFH